MQKQRENALSSINQDRKFLVPLEDIDYAKKWDILDIQRNIYSCNFFFQKKLHFSLTSIENTKSSRLNQYIISSFLFRGHWLQQEMDILQQRNIYSCNFSKKSFIPH